MSDVLEGVFKTTDGFDNFLTRVGANAGSAMSAATYTYNLITKNRQLLEITYRGSWTARVIVDAIAEDMTREGITITTNEANEDLKDLASMITRLKIWESIQKNIKWGRLYGGSIAVLQIRGAQTETPLRIDTIGKDQFQGLAVYDRWRIQPDLTNLIQEGPDAGLPMFYDIISTVGEREIAGKRYHHSRVIRAIGPELPYFQAIAEMLWGESTLEVLWDRIVGFDNATLSASQLIDRANLRTVGVKKLREILAAGGKSQAALEKMFEMMRLTQSNMGLTLLDSEDTFQSTSYTFSGLPETILQLGQQLSGGSGIPLIRFFGQAPAGLGATGDGEIRMYYNNIKARQESDLRAQIDKIIRVMWRSLYGKPAPKDLDFTFNPLWETNKVEQADVTQKNTDTILRAYDAGLVSKPAAMEDLRTAGADAGIFSNITDEEIEEAKTEEPLPEFEVNLNKPGEPIEAQ